MRETLEREVKMRAGEAFTGVRAQGAGIVHDTVSVLDNQRVSRSFEELEVELLEGNGC